MISADTDKADKVPIRPIIGLTDNRSTTNAIWTTVIPICRSALLFGCRQICPGNGHPLAALLCWVGGVSPWVGQGCQSDLIMIPKGCSKNENFPGRSALLQEECTNLRSNHELYIKKNIFTKKCTSSRKIYSNFCFWNSLLGRDFGRLRQNDYDL